MANLREVSTDPEKARNFLLGASMIAAMRRNAEMTLEDG